MKRNGKAVGLLLGLVVGLLAGCAGEGNDAAPTVTTSESSQSHNAADVTFAKDMVTHHRGALAISKGALAAELPPEVNTVAERIYAAQSAEIATLTEWLTAWGESVPSAASTDSAAPNPHAGHGGPPPTDAPSPGGSGAQPTTPVVADDAAAAFLTTMIEHHNAALEMATTETEQGSYQPAKDLAARISQTQQAEITRMSEILVNLK